MGSFGLNRKNFNPITSDIMALLLGSTSEACASLRESIRENKGIIHPIFITTYIPFFVGAYKIYDLEPNKQIKAVGTLMAVNILLLVVLVPMGII